MTPTWSRRGSKRWSYYVSQAILRGDKNNAGSVARVSAPEVERRVIEAIAAMDQQPANMIGYAEIVCLDLRP
jgi:site-specific DNA recombinase